MQRSTTCLCSSAQLTDSVHICFNPFPYRIKRIPSRYALCKVFRMHPAYLSLASLYLSAYDPSLSQGKPIPGTRSWPALHELTAIKHHIFHSNAFYDYYDDDARWGGRDHRPTTRANTLSETCVYICHYPRIKINIYLFPLPLHCTRATLFAYPG